MGLSSEQLYCLLVHGVMLLLYIPKGWISSGCSERCHRHYSTGTTCVNDMIVAGRRQYSTGTMEGPLYSFYSGREVQGAGCRRIQTWVGVFVVTMIIYIYVRVGLFVNLILAF